MFVPIQETKIVPAVFMAQPAYVPMTVGLQSSKLRAWELQLRGSNGTTMMHPCGPCHPSETICGCDGGWDDCKYDG